MTFDHLFKPIKIGSLELPNRVMMGSMHVGLEGVEDGAKALEVFYQTRAKSGGPGLIVTGGVAVIEEGEGGNHFLGFYREEDCEVLRSVVNAVHEVGGRLAAQLFHAGRYAVLDPSRGIQAVAPSAIRSPIHRHTPIALTEEGIFRTIEAFAESAKQAQSIGFDALEIMGSEGYLINQFLSPVTNQREDDWGGSFEKRLAFPLAVIREIRRKVGPDYPVIFRMSGIDLIPGSSTDEETLEMAQRFEAAGVDALNIGIGWHESAVPTISTMVPRAGFIDYAQAIKQVVEIPVVGSNRINDPAVANRLLKEEKCDLVSMARPFLADPELLQKAAAGETDRINTCVACNQACLDHVFEGKPASCLVNPRAGREHHWLLERVSVPRRVGVIGGGVAGLEAARSLASAGHHLTLFEANSRIGGQLLLAKEIPGKEEFAETLRYYETELERLGVSIRLNTEVTEETLSRHGKFDQVVVAVGVTPRIPTIKGIEGPNVMTYAELLSGVKNPGNRVVIIGAGGIGCDVAHYLIDKGITDIKMLRRNGRMGDGLGKTTKWALLQHLRENGVQFLTQLRYREITSEGIWINRLTEGRETESLLLKADTIVLAAGQESNAWVASNDLFTKIGGARYAGELDAKRAIYEGARLAYTDRLVKRG
ncbi:FAD-dependent oxidoreductase [Pullulanibacillus sp. KACC 23026]|uniref:NADPH-dependent 2,4-dienoyl-CoA reductase n=1 Tax=Pullulanibacillus sp. KACC 23026 TaxID=3028315 RepID=UPI0023AF23BA|nr:NADPH-dependent 2,4-dienoyl-CoA reductase [Pullulanibacillus sp. KACC 23026]WEG11788.1 FAD-dependent oxidoreductase [Pullulanibacillus sp. KACC 23026]